MESLKLAPKTAVWVEWEDSASLHGWTIGPPKLEYGKIDTVGLVASCSKEQLTISMAINDDGSALCPISIPWSAIQAIRELR